MTWHVVGPVEGGPQEAVASVTPGGTARFVIPTCVETPPPRASVTMMLTAGGDAPQATPLQSAADDPSQAPRRTRPATASDRMRGTFARSAITYTLAFCRPGRHNAAR